MSHHVHWKQCFTATGNFAITFILALHVALEYIAVNATSFHKLAEAFAFLVQIVFVSPGIGEAFAQLEIFRAVPIDARFFFY